MPRYKYKAVGTNGQIQQGEIEAASQEAVIRNLQDTGHLPISTSEITSRNWLHQFLLKSLQRRNTVTRKDIVLFMNELATLLQAGLPIDNALRTMERLATSTPLKALINGVLRQIQEGLNLSDAMADQPNAFNRLQLNMIRAGEAGGELHKVIGELADYMERMNELRNSVITALIYPAILIVMSVLSLFVLMTFVVPKFIPLFEDVGQALPLLTQITFGLAGLLQSTWWIILCLLAFSVWYLDRQFANPIKRRQFDTWCLRLPILRDLIKNMEIARFARTLGTLVNNGVPLLSAVVLAKDVINNRRLGEVVAG